MKTHDNAKAFEVRLAREFGGRRIAFSGSGIEKADVRRGTRYQVRGGELTQAGGLRFRVEAKTTSNASFTFKVQDWADLLKSSGGAGEIPVLAIGFLDSSGRADRHSPFLIQEGFARALRFSDNPLPLEIKKSWGLNKEHLLAETQRRHITFCVGARRESLMVVEMTRFFQGLADYEATNKERHGYPEPSDW